MSSKTNQKILVLDYMKKHGSITSMEAFYNLHITRLSAVIFDLNQSHLLDDENLYIEREMEQSVNEYGSTVRYARYYLMED